ncbi:hypothetical protein BLOT_002541 [Blomia tropicalis]|nr:hypothetical protein BLOT_002541 [Blomia tropicalis]
MKHRTRLTRHQTFDLHQKLPLFSVTIKSSLTNKNGQMFISLYENFVLTCNFTGNLEPKLSDEIPTRLRWTPKIKFFHSNIELDIEHENTDSTKVFWRNHPSLYPGLNVFAHTQPMDRFKSSYSILIQPYNIEASQGKYHCSVELYEAEGFGRVQFISNRLYLN